MKVVYVAGPFRADTTWEIEQNVREAEEVSLEVWRAGAVAICPHTNTRFFQGSAPDRVWIEGTLEILRRCDALMVVRTRSMHTGRVSSGTEAEIRLARDLGKPVFFHLSTDPARDRIHRGVDWGDFIQWLRDGPIEAVHTRGDESTQVKKVRE